MADGTLQQSGLTPIQYNPVNPLAQAQAAASLGNTLQQNALLKQSTTNAGIAGEQAQTNLNNQGAANYARASFGLLSLPPDQTSGQSGYDNIKRSADELLAQSNTPSAANIHAQLIASLPPAVGSDGKPTDYTGWIKQHAFSAASNFTGPQLAQVLLGTQVPSTLPGGMTQIQQVPGIGAPAGTPVRPIGQPIGGGMSPEAGSDLVNVIDTNTGRNQQVPRAQIPYLAPGWSVAPNQSGAPAPMQPPQGSAPPQGSVPPPGGPRMPVPGQSAPTAPQVPGGPLQPPQAPQAKPFGMGQAAPLPQEIDTAATARNQGQADLSALTSSNWNDQQASLNTIRNLSQGGVSTGKGTDFQNRMSQVFTNIAPPVAKALGIDPSKADDTQEVAKAMARVAASQGNRSDAQQFLSAAANPNTEMSPGALQRVAGYVMALNNQQRVLTQEAVSKATNMPKDTTTQYPAVRLQIQNQTDPNAFRAPYMAPDELNSYVKSLSPAQARKFDYTLNLIQKYNTPQGGLTSSVTPQQ